MNVLPLTTDTIGRYTFLDTLADSSGNGNNLTVAYGSEIYETVTGGFGTLRGFRLDDGGPAFGPENGLVTGVAPALQIGGDLTVQYIWVPRKTTLQWQINMYSGTDPDIRADPKLYAFAIGAAGDFVYFDQFHEGFVVDFAFQPQTFVASYVTSVYPVNMGTAYLFTYRRTMTGAATSVVDMFINDQLIASIASHGNTPTGSEKLRVGSLTDIPGFSGPKSSGVIGSLRFLNSSRPTDTIGDDYHYAFFGVPYPSANTNIVYDAVAAAMFANAIHSNPRAPS